MPSVSIELMSQPASAAVTKKLWILVPKPESNPRPTHGSGIVGSPSKEKPTLIRVDFEGNIYGCENLSTYWDRLFHAAGRHVTHYPTVAREYLHEGPFFPYLRVGLFNYEAAVATVRSREFSVEQAMKKACEIDLTLKDMFEEWAGPLF